MFMLIFNYTNTTKFNHLPITYKFKFTITL